MRRFISILFAVVLILIAMPVMTEASGLVAEGGFSSRLLSRSENIAFNLTVKNPLSETKSAVLIFGKYAAGKLQATEIYYYDDLAPGNTEITKNVPVFDSETDKISAFLFESLPDASPVYIGDIAVDFISSYMNNNLVTQAFFNIPEGDEFTSRFPICVDFSYGVDRATVAGAGMLAEFGEGGPKEVYIKSIKKAGNDTMLYKQFRTVRVIDPNGKVMCCYDFSEKDLESEEIVLSVPESDGGIWTISYTGGAPYADHITVGIPESDAWGIRGEMSFKFIPNTPREWYVYVPPKSTGVCKIKKGGYADGIVLYDESGAVIEENAPDNSYYTYEIIPEKTDVVWKVRDVRALGHENTSELITFATGIPGLLCPTEEMARTLKGGTAVSSDGKILGGNYQKLVREAMLRHKYDDLSVSLDFLSEIPSIIKDEELDAEALLYGVYGGLSGLQNGLGKQILDSTSPFYGGFPSDENDFSVSYEGFIYGGRHTMGQSAGLAAVSAIPSKMNPAYGNRALITRSMLAAMVHFASMSPEMLIRENVNSSGNFWPMQHVFFIYPNLAEAYGLLKSKVTPYEAELWRNGLVLVGDKLANYTASQSNQWSEVIYGHLLTYRATGEERFLKYFERAAESFTKENLHFAGSHGQHASGYYMEAYAPSGSYQDLSMHNIAAAYLEYRRLEERNDELCEALYSSIEKAVTYESLFWLKQPGGGVVSPTSVNLRAPTEMMSNCGYPGTFLAATAFPGANGLIDLLPYSESYYSYGKMMPHIALNNPPLARKIIEAGLITQDKSTNGGISGAWTPRVYEAYSDKNRITDKITAPIYETEKVWDLDGTVAVKKNGWYVLTAYSARATDGSKRSGLPCAVWHEAFGAFLTSMNLSDSDISKTVHTRIEAAADGVTYKTAHENGTLTWIINGESFKITQAVGSLGSAEITTEISDTGLDITVLFTNTSKSSIESAYVVLPLNISQGTANLSDGVLTYTVGESVLEISCAGMEWYSDSISTKAGAVRELKIPISTGESSTIEFNVK